MKELLKEITKECVQLLNNLLAGQLDKNLIYAALAKPELNYFSPEILLQNPNSDLYKEVVNLAKENAIEHKRNELEKVIIFFILEIKRQFKMLAIAMVDKELEELEKFCDAHARYLQTTLARIQDMKEGVVHLQSASDLLKKFSTPTVAEYAAHREEHFFKPLREKVRPILENRKEETRNDVEFIVKNNPSTLKAFALLGRVDENAPEDEIIEAATKYLSKVKVKEPLSKTQEMLLRSFAEAYPDEYSVNSLEEIKKKNNAQSNENSDETKGPVLTEQQKQVELEKVLGKSLEAMKAAKEVTEQIEVMKDLSPKKIFAIIKDLKNEKTKDGKEILGKSAKENLKSGNEIYEHMQTTHQEHVKKTQEKGWIVPEFKLDESTAQFMEQENAEVAKVSQKSVEDWIEARKDIGMQHLQQKMSETDFYDLESENLFKQVYSEQEQKSFESKDIEKPKAKTTVKEELESIHFSFDDLAKLNEDLESENINSEETKTESQTSHFSLEDLMNLDEISEKSNEDPKPKF